MRFDIKWLLRLQGSRALNILRWMGGRSLALGALQFFVTENCNYRCNMCDIGQRNLKKIPLNRDMVPFELMDKALTETASWFPRPRVHFIGGEPLMYKALPRAAARLRELGFWWGFTTNGWFLERDAELLVEHRCAAINVSVDGPADAHDAIRGIAHAFDKALAGIARIREVQKTRKQNKPAIAVNCVVNPANQDRLEEVVQAFADVGVDTINFQHLIWSEQENPEFAAQIDPEKLRKFIEKARSGVFPIRVLFLPDLAPEKLEPYYQDLYSPLLATSCSWPWLVARVMPDGNVVLCMDTLGNLNETPLAEMWNGAAAQQMRRRMLAKPASDPMCVRCCHRQY
jgi:MoaA/NifB/PqqE/SkfB family radical SAM enzyme